MKKEINVLVPVRALISHVDSCTKFVIKRYQTKVNLLSTFEKPFCHVLPRTRSHFDLLLHSFALGKPIGFILNQKDKVLSEMDSTFGEWCFPFQNSMSMGCLSWKSSTGVPCEDILFHSFLYNFRKSFTNYNCLTLVYKNIKSVS